jgi:NADH-quinone oxidoreductase subunit N
MEFYMFLEAVGILTILNILVLRIKAGKFSIGGVAEVATLYLIVSIVSGGIILVGFILLLINSNSSILSQIEWYIIVGNHNYIGNWFWVSSMNLMVPGILMLVVGMSFKLGLFPLHYWLSDLYEGTSSMFLVLYNLLIKPVLFIWFMRVYLLYSFSLCDFTALLVGLGIGSILSGFFGSLDAISLKAFLAYSGIFQVGFTVLSLVPGGLWQGVETAVFYYVAYTFHIIPVLIVLSTYEGAKLGYQKSTNIIDLQNLCRRNIFKSSVIALSFFSFIGLPPTLGFFSKMSLIFYITDMLGIGCGLFLVIMTLGSSYYYLRVIKVIFFSSQEYRNSYSVLTRLDFTWCFYMSVYILVTVGIIFCVYVDQVHSLILSA